MQTLSRKTRVLAGVVGAFCLESGVHAQEPSVTLWLQATDGSDHIVRGISGTAVVQLWMDVGSGMPLVSIDALLETYDGAFVPNASSFDVYGFNDITITNSQLQRRTRGSAEPASPGSPSDLDGATSYHYVGDDPTAFNGTDGILGPRTVLLDEIIIHINAETPEGPDMVMFNFTGTPPTGSYMDIGFFPPPGAWSVEQLTTVALGTGSVGNPLLVEEEPEPSSLTLLLVGGLAALRRRR